MDNVTVHFRCNYVGNQKFRVFTMPLDDPEDVRETDFSLESLAKFTKGIKPKSKQIIVGGLY